MHGNFKHKTVFFLFLLITLPLISGNAQTERIKDSLFSLIETATDDSMVMEWYNQLRRLYINEDPEEALRYSKQYALYAKRLKLDKKYAVAKAYEATSYVPMGLYDEALRALIEAEGYFQRLKDTLSLSSVYNSIGAVYEKTGRDSLAHEYFYKCYQLAESQKDPRRQVLALNNMSNIYLRRGDPETSRKTLQKALNLSGFLPADHTIFLRLNYANTLIETGEDEEAKQIFKDILSEEKASDNFTMTIANKGFATLLYNSKKYEEALTYFARAESIALANNFPEEELEIKRYLHKTYRHLNRYQQAYEYFLQYDLLKDSLTNIEKDKNLIDALTKYDSEKKQKEIIILSSQNEIKDLKIEKAANMRIALFTGIAGLSMVTFFAFRLQFVKSRTNKLLTQKNEKILNALHEKNILLREIHHRVKNNLQVISSLLKLQAQYIKDESAIMAIAEGRNRVNSMALLHQNLYREDNLTGVDMREYFTSLIEGLFDTYNIEAGKIKLKTDIKPLCLDIDTVIPLGLIANELVSNSLKHAFVEISDAVLSVDLWEDDHILYFKVRDNGAGLTGNNNGKKGNGFGHKLIHALAEKLDASIEFKNSEGMEILLIIRDYRKAS